MVTTGSALTVTAPVVAVQLAVPDVKVKVAVPADMPVTNPALVTVATAGLLLVQMPPVVGDKVVVCPTQILALPVMLATGCAVTVTVPAVAVQLVVPSVKVNVAMPAEIPVTNPVLSTVATRELLLAQVPPVVGDKVVV